MATFFCCSAQYRMFPKLKTTTAPKFSVFLFRKKSKTDKVSVEFIFIQEKICVTNN